MPDYETEGQAADEAVPRGRPSTVRHAAVDLSVIAEEEIISSASSNITGDAEIEGDTDSQHLPPPLQRVHRSSSKSVSPATRQGAEAILARYKISTTPATDRSNEQQESVAQEQSNPSSKQVLQSNEENALVIIRQTIPGVSPFMQTIKANQASTGVGTSSCNAKLQPPTPSTRRLTQMRQSHKQKLILMIQNNYRCPISTTSSIRSQSSELFPVAEVVQSPLQNLLMKL